ncbi:MAG: hypothetical protein AAGD14_19935 [Planctomycetota bacterium]
MKLPADGREFIELLNSHEVEYLVVGGYAVGFHGYPRYTGDIEFFVRADEANANRLVDLLGAFGFADAEQLRDNLTRPDQIIQLGMTPYRIDLLTSISGVSFDRAWSGRVAGKLGDVEVPLIGREELLENKRQSNRAKDRADIEELEGPSPGGVP